MASAALLCLLIAAEAMAVVHSLDLDAHVSGDPCKICISVASLGGAAPARPPTLLPPLVYTFEPLPEPLRARSAGARPPTARGPPQAS